MSDYDDKIQLVASHLACQFAIMALTKVPGDHVIRVLEDSLRHHFPDLSGILVPEAVTAESNMVGRN